MRRTLTVTGLTALAVASAATLATAAPGPHGTASHHFTDHLLGATVQTQGKRAVEVFRVSTSDSGPGASVSVTRSTSATTGTLTSVIYFAAGSVRSSGTYRISTPTPGAPDVVKVTLSGHTIGGTGTDKGATGSFHGTGTDNTKTKTQTLTVSGTITP
jgi:hypothetical protein